MFFKIKDLLNTYEQNNTNHGHITMCILRWLRYINSLGSEGVYTAGGMPYQPRPQ